MKRMQMTRNDLFTFDTDKDVESRISLTLCIEKSKSEQRKPTLKQQQKTVLRKQSTQAKPHSGLSAAGKPHSNPASVEAA